MFIFVVKPLGKCRGWGSSRPIALLSTSPEARCAARLVVFRPRCLTASLVRGLSFSWTAGRCPLPVRNAGHWRGPGMAVGGGVCGRVSGPSRGSPQIRSRWGPPPAVRLGWRLAADSELVRTREI
ncbi:unnamed protein product [Pleuronectes platessa]|uniref:Uncharacterized protein n=1 Tax=Pleuronectes platessa TaxID=8262 RepID=A0A9N7UHT0_PLEPL|nr:unnamed protein product [Pleuronectes platessa]